MEKEGPKHLWLSDYGFWTQPESSIDTSIVWKKRGTGTMKYGRLSIEPFPGEFKETASEWMLMEGIPLLITLENENGRKLEMLCQADPEETIHGAFFTLVHCQRFLMYGPPLHVRLSFANSAMLLTWLSDFELEVSIVPEWYIAGEFPADSELITSLLEKTGRDKLSSYTYYDGFMVGYDGPEHVDRGRRRRPQWKYGPSQERLVKLVVIPEGLGTIITAEDFFDSLMKMWTQIVERMGRDEVGISEIEGLGKIVKSLRDPEVDKKILEHRRKQAKKPIG